jgi:hypothetical protein
MKCPHCGYQDGWDNEELKTVDGEEGDFFRLPITMTRDTGIGCCREERNLRGCPSCGKVFIA